MVHLSLHLIWYISGMRTPSVSTSSWWAPPCVRYSATEQRKRFIIASSEVPPTDRSFGFYNTQSSLHYIAKKQQHPLRRSSKPRPQFSPSTTTTGSPSSVHDGISKSYQPSATLTKYPRISRTNFYQISRLLWYETVELRLLCGGSQHLPRDYMAKLRRLENIITLPIWSNKLGTEWKASL